MTSPVDTSVKYFSSTMLAAPVLSGTPGTVISILDSCLVTGFDSKTATSLVVLDGVATLSYTGSHSAVVDSVVLVENASIAALNGEQRVIAVAAGVVRFATAAVNGTDAGAVTFKIAPAGWAKSFSGTNLAVYRSTDVASTKMSLRVDDTFQNSARIRAYETMSDVSTGQGSTPLESQCVGGLYWSKSKDADTSAKPWFVIADTRGVYYCVDPTGNTACQVMYAGDFKSRKSGDAYGFIVTGNPSDNTNVGGGSGISGCVGNSNRQLDTTAAYIVRSHTALGSSVLAYRVGAHHIGPGSISYSGSAAYGIGTYPNAAGNELLTSEVEIYNVCLRGSFPGILHAIQDVGGAFTNGTRIDGTDYYSGRRLMSLRVGAPQNGPQGTVFFDINGPWRS